MTANRRDTALAAEAFRASVDGAQPRSEILPRRPLVRLIDRYILGKVWWRFAATLAIVTVGMLLDRMLRLTDLVINQGAPFSLVLKMMGALVPYYLGSALPLAFMVSVILALTTMNEDGELDAVESSGLGSADLLRPIAGAALVLMALSAVIYAYLNPHGRYLYHRMVYQVTRTVWDAKVTPGAFLTGFGNMTITVRDTADSGRRLSGVFIDQHGPFESSASNPAVQSIITTAEHADVLKSRDRLVLRLRKGVRIEVARDQAESTIMTFQSFDVPIDLETALAPFRARGQSQRELTLPELFRMSGSTASASDRGTGSRAEMHDRLVRIAAFAFLPMLVIPLGVSTRRAQHGAGLALSVVLVVIYDHTIKFAHHSATLGLLPPWIVLWTPYALFAGLSVWLFYTGASRAGEGPLFVAIEGLEERLTAGARWVRRVALNIRRPRRP